MNEQRSLGRDDLHGTEMLDAEAMAAARPGSETVTTISLRRGNSRTAATTAARDSAELS